jgi:undecaprenyl-diphosphatase
MLNNMQIVVLSVLQGVTEFLPISSSAHLILLPKILGWPDQGLAFDIAVHVGTLVAIVSYFRKELVAMTIDWVKYICGNGATQNSNLAWMVIWGTIPVGLVGFFSKHIVETALRSEFIIVVTTILFGVLMGIAYKIAQCKRDEYAMRWKDVLIIGLSQVIALIPGTSRSGITATAGLMVGLTPKAAARYSFLLAIPVIASAGLLQSIELLHSSIVVPWKELFYAMFLAAVSGYMCIYFFLKLLNRIGFYPFVIYRIILGIFLFVIFY